MVEYIDSYFFAKKFSDVESQLMQKEPCLGFDRLSILALKFII
jgi:hypothetical protein